MSLLTKDNVEKVHPDAKKDLETNHIEFSTETSQKGKRHKVLVGVYAHDKGSGRFLLILENEKSGWKKVFLKKDSYKSGFSGLLKTNHSLMWCTCMECDGCQSIEWGEKRGYSLKTTVPQRY